MEQFFKVKEHGSTVKIEVMAGITTFMAMAYILMVNAGMFANLEGVSYNAVYIATALSAVIGTFLMAFLANLPLGLASGMGLNAFFVYTACFTFGLSYANALVLVPSRWYCIYNSYNYRYQSQIILSNSRLRKKGNSSRYWSVYCILRSSECRYCCK